MGRLVARRIRPGRWLAVVVAATTVPLALVGGSGPAAQAATGVHRFVPVAPVRVMDTRSGLGHGSALATGESVALDLGALVPTDAVAVALNVTATDGAGPLYVTAWGDGDRPTASSLNVEAAGQTIANLVTVPVSAGRVRLFASGRVHLVADLAGWYVPAPSGTATDGRYELIGPARVLDTRAATGAHPGRLVAGESVTVDLTAVGVPASAGAALVNLTATETTGPGYWTAHPAGVARPAASNVNVDRAGQTIANQAVVALTAGRFTVFAQTGGHLVVDVSGYFTGAGAVASPDGLFVPERPRRILDTRGGARPAVGRDLLVTVEGTTAPRAFATNLTLTGSLGGGYVSAWTGRGAWPGVSSVNASRADQTIANHAVVPASGDRFALRVAVPSHVVVDVVGWYTGGDPAPTGWVPDPPAPGTQGPPANVPASSSEAPYAFLIAGAAPGALPARWDPCADIDYLVNWGADAHPGADQAIADVVQVLYDTSGLRLVDRGATTLTADDPLPAGIEAVIEFTSLGGSGPAGVGGGRAMTSSTAGVYGRIVEGSVQLNTDYDFVPGWGGNGLHGLLAHELGHMVGLGHVPSPLEVMYPVMRTRSPGYSVGDTNGLRYLYGGGCTAPAPQTASADVGPPALVRFSEL